MPDEDAVGLLPLSRHATQRSKDDIPANIEVDDGAGLGCACLTALR